MESKGLSLFISQLPGCNQGIDASQTGTTQDRGQAYALGSLKPREGPVAAVLCYYSSTVEAVDVVFKERLENWLGKGMPWTSANGAPGGALGWGWMESARVELGVALTKQSKKLHFNIAGI